MEPDGDVKEPKWLPSLREWRQGDYTLNVRQVLTVDEIEGGDLLPSGTPVEGLCAISQTCDIVNWGPGKEWVVLAPLVELDGPGRANALSGRTPSIAVLDCAPTPDTVVDLNRMMTVHKSLLASVERQPGLKSDRASTRFAESLQRKYGRFAFPDAFNDAVLGPLRKRVTRAHGKDSENGRAYCSIAHVRVAAAPSWEAEYVTVGFRFVLEEASRRKADRREIAKVIQEHFGKLKWPEGFAAQEPPFTIQTLDEMTAAEWTESQAIDWDFISQSKND